LGESQALKALLQKAAETGCLLAAICAAPSVLDRWGLINGKRMTCYPTYASKIKHGIVVDAAVVTVPGLITGRGVGVALAFGLAIVAALKGSAESEALRKAMVMPE
jgi:4-methyl-5(b-hydroxyethyl)-thiazole monophosphate biosynthesis